MIAGITGGLGCGKSTVARALERRGFRRLDSDQIVREQVLAEPDVIAAIRERFGEAVIATAAAGPVAGTGDGGDAETRRPGDGAQPGSHRATFPHLRVAPSPRLTINRPALAARVFADDAERAWLEDLTHPRVFAAWRAAFAADPQARWAVEVPLLFEKGLENWFDFTLCVACAPTLQLARLEQRGLPRALAGQRISKQLPLARKIERSDFVLWNEGSPAFLEAQIDRLNDALAAA